MRGMPEITVALNGVEVSSIAVSQVNTNARRVHSGITARASVLQGDVYFVKEELGNDTASNMISSQSRKDRGVEEEGHGPAAKKLTGDK